MWISGLLARIVRSVWSFWLREWKFVVCFALVAHLAIAAAGFLERSGVTVTFVDCHKAFRLRC